MFRPQLVLDGGAIIVRSTFGTPIIVIEISIYYNSYLAIVKLFENFCCLQRLLFYNHPLS